MNGQIIPRNKLPTLSEYIELPGVNQSTLKKILKSPKHYKDGTNREKAPTRPMSQGTAGHIAVLEPARFMTHFAMWDRRSESGNLCPRKGQHWDAFLAENEGKEIVTENDYLNALDMQVAVRSDSVAGPLLQSGEPEVTLLWTDARTGLACKCRLDWLTRKAGRILDIKGTGRIEREIFFSHFDRMGYDFQTAFYASGYRTIFDEWPVYKVLAVELDAPHDVVVYNVPTDWFEEDYENQVVPALQDLKQCQADERWPGVANGFELQMERPRWRRRDDETDDLSELELTR